MLCGIGGVEVLPVFLFTTITTTPTTTTITTTTATTPTGMMPHFPLGSGIEMETDHQEDSMSTSKPKQLSVETRVKNRRKRYLDLHPEYFSADLELAGPLALPRAFLLANRLLSRLINHGSS